MHLSKAKPRTKQSLDTAAADDEEESSPPFTLTTRRKQASVPKQPPPQQRPSWWFLNCTIPFHIHVVLILGSNVLVYCLCSYEHIALGNNNNISDQHHGREGVVPGIVLNEVEKNVPRVKREHKSSQPGEGEELLMLLSSNHSFGYFTDISNDDWRRFYQQPIIQRRQQQQQQQNAPNASYWKQQRKSSHGKINGDVLDAQWLYQHYNPVFVCPHARKIGNPGGKWMCDPERFYQTVLPRLQQEEERHVSLLSQQPNNLDQPRPLPCLVYSVGSHGNFRWEDDLIDIVLQGRTDLCEIHMFDPFPLSYYYSKENEELQRVQRHLLSRNMHYHAWGWIGTNTTHRLAARLKKNADNFKTLPETRRLLGHDYDRLTLDILKMDCEGCEWETSFDWLGDDDGIHIRHLLLETHSLPWPDQIRRTAYYGHFPAMNVVHDFFERLLRVSPSPSHKNHHELSVLKTKRNDDDGAFVLYSKEVNTHRGEGRCVEWSFLRLQRDLFTER